MKRRKRARGQPEVKMKTTRREAQLRTVPSVNAAIIWRHWSIGRNSLARLPRVGEARIFKDR